MELATDIFIVLQALVFGVILGRYWGDKVAQWERLELAKKSMRAEGDALLEKMQTPKAKKAAKELFKATSTDDKV